MATHKILAPGPFRAQHLPPGSDYELVNGHPVLCAPTGRSGAGAILDGGSVIRSDPKVKRAGVDPGFSPDDLNVRAPDIAIIPEDGDPGWIPGVPGFAVEYAGIGQDEQKLQEKIRDLLARGSRLIWVVRLVGPRRVEVYSPGAEVRLFVAGETLEAPEFLQNSVPVEALWEPDAADRATLRNLLERFGFRDVEAIRQEGREEGREEGGIVALRAALLTVLTSRGLVPEAATEARIQRESDAGRLKGWIERAATADHISRVIPD